MNFQRKEKMSQNANLSQSLLEKDSPKFQCSVCQKPYKVEGALKNHMKNFHGLEDGVFDPAASSTAVTEEFLERIKEDVFREGKRKRSSEKSDDLDDFDDDNEENLEEALKAKKIREERLAKLNKERDAALGVEEDPMRAGGSNTQEIFQDLQQTVEKSKNHADRKSNETSQEFEEPSQLSANDNNNSVMLVDDNKEEEKLKKRIDDLEKLMENKDTQILDLQIKVREQNDQLDDKDRIIREKRQLIKIKQDEIDDLYRDKQDDAAKVLKSPLKQQMKAEAEKAKRQIEQQLGRIKNLEKANKELQAKLDVADKEEQPKLKKLKQTAHDLIERAEFMKNEKDELNGTIAKLKRKIPCPNFPTCEYGRKCQYSHTHKYSSQRLDNVKTIPCIHYINNRCRNTAADCNFSHDQAMMSANQKHEFLENSLKNKDGNDEDRRGQYQRPQNKGYQSKRRKISETEDRRQDSSWSINDTRNFPEPVPAVSKRGSYDEYSPRNNSTRSSGNDQGARARRSSLATPRGRSGSQRRGRGASLSRSRHSPNRSNRSSNHHQNRWDQEQNQAGSSKGSRRW